MNLLKHLSLSLMIALAFTAFASQAALAEKTGNGGGAWVCRSSGPNGPVSKIVSLDLWEAEAPVAEGGMGLVLEDFSGKKYTQIVQELKLRLFEANDSLYNHLKPYFARIGNLAPDSKRNIKQVAGLLSRIPDSEWSNGPDPAVFCPTGYMLQDPEQVIRYNDGSTGPLDEVSVIDIRKPLWNALDETNKAAFVFHEAIYAYRRDTAGNKNSVKSRQMVGLIFACQDPVKSECLIAEELKAALEKLGEGEVPITGQISDKSFAKIPAGSFMMGSHTDEADRDPWGLGEAQHSVTIAHSFEMMKTEVTQSQWFAVMGNNPSSFVREENCPKDHSPLMQIIPGFTGCPNNPVENVYWDDIQQFLVKLNQAKRDGYFYRLPTEAEWEYAARGCGSTKGCATTAYYWGPDSSQAFAYAWYDSSSGKMTHEVSTLKPNAHKLYDMAGNVWEWVSDYYTKDYEKYGNGGPSSGSFRVFRGGSWGSYARNLRSALRYYADASSYRFNGLGFRLARSQ